MKITKNVFDEILNLWGLDVFNRNRKVNEINSYF